MTRDCRRRALIASCALVWAALVASLASGAQRSLVNRTAAEYGAVAADFDGDGRDDISVKNDGGTWRIDLAYNGYGAWDLPPSDPQGGYKQYGGIDSIPVPADYDGDRKADLAVAFSYQEDGAHRVHWLIDYSWNGLGGWDRADIDLAGAPGARFVPADYDGDGHADLAIKGDDGVWRIDYYLAQLGLGTPSRSCPISLRPDAYGCWDDAFPAYGGEWAEPVPADYDGDGKTDLSVKDDSGTWYIDYAADGLGGWNASFPHYGDASARPVPADYDGDRKADLSVKSDAGTWYIDFAANGFGGWDTSFPAPGGAAARPIPGNYDGVPGAEAGGRTDCGPWFYRRAWGTDRLSSTTVTVSSTDTFRNAQNVATRSDLVTALSSDFEGIVNVTESMYLTPPFYELEGDPMSLPIKSCVHLKGSRARLDPGAMLSDGRKDFGHHLLEVHGHDVRIEGLRFQGPTEGSRDISIPNSAAIAIVVDTARGLGRNIHLTGNEFWFWPSAGVAVIDLRAGPPMTADQASLISVTRNYIHDNARDGGGYGVVISGGYALVEGNLFDRNRHAVAASGAPNSGYVARYNYVLAGGYTQVGDDFYDCPFWNQHFDVHGTDGDDGYGGPAGEYFEIAYNTIRGEQGYCVWKTRPAFLLRGTPALGAYFNYNFTVHDSLDAAVALKSDKQDTGYGEDHAKFNFHATGNRFDADPSLDIAVAGDLDGDGLDDIFLANGTGWWYSSAGQTEWRFLRASPLPTSLLRFGQFDADPRADVFVVDGDANLVGNQWKYSSGGSGPLVDLGTRPTPLADLLFGDFDGNGRTDVLCTTGADWYLYYSARGSATWMKPSSHRAAQLRVGNFDAQGGDDVFGYANAEWSYWRHGITGTGWERLRSALATDVSSLVVGDFDADGQDDLAQTNGNVWRYSSGAKAAWANLPGASFPDWYRDIRRALLGQFNEDGRADALRFKLIQTCNTYCVWLPSDYAVFVGWDGIGSGFNAWTPAIAMR